MVSLGLVGMTEVVCSKPWVPKVRCFISGVLLKCMCVLHLRRE